MAQQVTIWFPNSTLSEDAEFAALTNIAQVVADAFPGETAYLVEEAGSSEDETFTCEQHGGEWGDDTTCLHCTDWDGNPRPIHTPENEQPY
jgi:hypothetical protein